MDNLSDRMKSFFTGLLIFVLLVFFFYLTKIDAYFILSIYLICFWVYISFYDLKNMKNFKVSSEDYDNPSLMELRQFLKIWKIAKNITQNLGFLLLIIAFFTEKNIPLFMIICSIMIGSSLLFDSMYTSDIKKIKELQEKEK